MTAPAEVRAEMGFDSNRHTDTMAAVETTKIQHTTIRMGLVLGTIVAIVVSLVV